MRAQLPIFTAVILLAQFACAADSVVVTSPDASVRFALLADGPQPRFNVTLDGKAVIEPSELRLTIDVNDVLQGARPATVDRYAADSTYPTRGVHSSAIDRHRGAKIALGQCVLEVRAFDDGAAYRFIVAGDAQ